MLPPRLLHPEEISGTLADHPNVAVDLRFLFGKIGVQLPFYRLTDNLALPYNSLEEMQEVLTNQDNVSFGPPYVTLRGAFDSKGAWIWGKMSLVRILNGASWKSSGYVRDLSIANNTTLASAMVLAGDYSRCVINGHVTIKGSVRITDNSSMNLGKIEPAPGFQVNRIIVGVGCSFRTTDPIPASVEVTFEEKLVVNVATRTGTVLKFDQNAEYQTIYNTTFTVDPSNAISNAVVTATLGPAATAPSIPNTFIKRQGNFESGKLNTYMFRVRASGKIEYLILTEDA